MSLLTEKLVGLPFGTAAVEELLRSGLLDANAIYRRREIVEALRRRFIELGGDEATTPQQVIVPLKRVLDGPLFVRIRPGFYRFVGFAANDFHSLAVRDVEPAVSEWRQGPEPAPWRSQLDGATTAHAIAATLRSHRRERVANRVDYLQELARSDPEEQPIAPESLWHMACFLLEQGHLPDPEVGVSPNGMAQAEWTIPATSDSRALGNGLLVMEFLPRATIRFAALSAPYRQGVDRLTVHGTLPAADALDAVRTFTARIART